MSRTETLTSSNTNNNPESSNEGSENSEAIRARGVPNDLQGNRYKDLKKKIIKPENREAVKQSWKRLLKAMEEELDKISGSDYIPEIDFSALELNNFTFPKEKLDLLHDRGCMIIRDVIDDDQAVKWKEMAINHIKKHPEVTGMPFSQPSNWYLHWTQSQTEARSHPRMVQLMKAIGKSFSNNNPEDLVDMESQVTYADRIRIRPPGRSYSLNLHADSSSFERWEDDGYRDVYREIFEGRWEDWDPFVINRRPKGKQDLYEHITANGSTSSVFRSCQGWLALSQAKCGEGTIRFLPNLKHVMPYLLLRPFFWNDESDEMDIESTKFPGATPGSGQFMAHNKNYFPHLNHDKSVVGIPEVRPGDYVLWHADLLHEVDKEHKGDKDSSVLYVSHNPLCEYNLETLLDSRTAFLAGTKPRDFLYELKRGPDESDFEDRGKPENVLSDEGRAALGLSKYNTEEEGISVGQKRIRELSNSILFPGD